MSPAVPPQLSPNQQLQSRERTDKKTPERRKRLRPPPINIWIGNLNRHIMTLNKLNLQSKVTLLAGDIYKINVVNDEQYRQIEFIQK